MTDVEVRETANVESAGKEPIKLDFWDENALRKEVWRYKSSLKYESEMAIQIA
jgi:hypothetical protein